MKLNKLLTAVIFLGAVNAHADSWELNNNAGGKIVLTDNVCYSNGKRYDNLRAMFSVSGTGKTFSGCYYVADGWVRVVYSDQTEYTYPASAFRQIKSGTAL